ncbi:large ribosomal subunit protein P2-like [Cloeon dipterum]|uniref:large ribosomal subunit protein P2-like n=1 Tax=Cloeon dipterum TaxID=197152 RepID=UPI00321F96EF
MRYVAAYLLASIGGKRNPSVADIEKILGSVGIAVDMERLNKVISELEGKNLDELIAQGQSKLVSVTAGSGTAVTAHPEETGSVASGEKKEEKKVEKKEEMSDYESDSECGLGDIFG